MDEGTIRSRISKLEKELKELKLEVAQVKKKDESTRNKTSKPEVGDLVGILNPRKGQETQGNISRIGRETKFVTIDTKKGKVVRHISNITVLKKKDA